MADPLSVIASIVGVAAAAIKMTTALNSIIDRYETAQDQVGQIANDLNLFSLTLEQLVDILNVPKDERVVTDVLIGSVQSIMNTCRPLFKVSIVV